MAADWKAVMVLGAAAAQVPIIEKVRQLGFKAIVVSSAGKYPGFAQADKSYEIDVRDREAVLVAARREMISGILTDQTDVSVPTVAYVAEKLGLPGIGYECSLQFTDKFLMRRAAGRLGVPVPRYFEAETAADAEQGAHTLRFPVMVKPVDSQGSRGVRRVPARKQLRAAVEEARRFSPRQRVIVEEFSKGSEVVVAGFASDYKFWNIAAAERGYFDLPDLFIPKSTIFPWSLSEELAAKVLKCNEQLIYGLKPRFGITHSEFLVDADSGDVRLVETAIRGGGVFISSDLVPHSSGIDVGKLLVEHATGVIGRVDLGAKRPSKAAGYFCFHLPEGVITRVIGVNAVKNMPGVRRAVLDNLQVGSRVPPLADKTGRLGPIIITGETRAECELTFAKVKEALHVEVQTARGIGHVSW